LRRAEPAARRWEAGHSVRPSERLPIEQGRASKNLEPHRGRTALVTGGSRGIGAATVRRLALEGADVAFSYLNSEQKAKELAAEVSAQAGVRVEALRADAAGAEEMAGLVTETVERLGRLDILVHNAGQFLTGLIGDSARDVQEVARQFDTNLHGVAAATHAAAPHLQEGGRIILISSLAASRIQGMPAGDYAAAKAAVEAYGRAWAHEFGPRGVTVNCLQLGPVETDMAPKEAIAAVLQSIPMRRAGKPEDIADVIAYLTSPGASWITGTTLRIDGGLYA
jgi:3-oxoacyl-[acyl-carrier protein] reductase